MDTLHFIFAGVFALAFLFIIVFSVYEHGLKKEGEKDSIGKFILALVLVILFFMVMGMCTGGDNCQWLPRHT